MENVTKLISYIVQLNGIQKRFLEHSMSLLSGHDLEMLDAYLRYCLDNNLSFEFLAKAYDLISKDTLKEQVFFNKHKRYRCTTYKEVASHVYQNNEYMSKYMYGLALTAFLWPNHLQMFKFFRDKLPKDLKGNYLEIGPGHGFFMMEAMRLSSYANYLGIDISPTSVEMTRNILTSGYFGEFQNFEIIQDDFLALDTREKFDAIIMGEVLEHVENPQAFLNKIQLLSSVSSYIYITTAINAPAIDHICLFENKEHLINIIKSCYFSITDMLVIPYTGKTIEESETNKLPMNIALVLKKNHG